MTDRETYDHLRQHPFWQVQAVFDPDGEGGDFAYTIGLHERGLPELHLWARPSVGEDPGLDWMFSMRDRTIILNELAAQLVTGAIGIGSEITREFDGGEAVVRFRVEPPGDRESLEAFGIAADAQVLPVPWSLERRPEGELAELDAAAEDVARRETTILLANLPGRLALPPRDWSSLPDLRGRLDFSPDQRYGPLTPLVRARAAQLWQADDRTLTGLLQLAMIVELGMGLTLPIPPAIAAARTVGRRPALEALRADVGELVDWLVSRPTAQRRWWSIVRETLGEGPGLSGAERRRAERNCAGMLHDLVLACLLVDAVSDVVHREVVLAGRGPWVVAVAEAGTEPSDAPDWWAPDEVLATVATLMRAHDGPTLARAALAHQEARGKEGAYADLAIRLESWAVTSAAGCPWEPVLSQLPAWDPWVSSVKQGLGANNDVEVRVARLPAVHRWATCLAAALTHRDRLSQDDVKLFLGPIRELLPQVASVLA